MEIGILCGLSPVRYFPLIQKQCDGWEGVANYLTRYGIISVFVLLVLGCAVEVFNLFLSVSLYPGWEKSLTPLSGACVK